jgi:hypothetical protein
VKQARTVLLVITYERRSKSRFSKMFAFDAVINRGPRKELFAAFIERADAARYAHPNKSGGNKK